MKFAHFSSESVDKRVGAQTPLANNEVTCRFRYKMAKFAFYMTVYQYLFTRLEAYSDEGKCTEWHLENVLEMILASK